MFIMLKYKNLTVLGTSHISSESIKEVKKTIIETNPKIVALELDYSRFQALISKEKGNKSIKYMFKVGFTGFLFALIGSWAEKKLGNVVGVSPGSEMKKAIELSKNLNYSISLIDQDINITLKNLSKRFTWKERFRFIFDLFRSLFTKQKINFDLKEVPSDEVIRKLLYQVRKRYPNLYKVLVKDRNIVMAKNLYNLINKNPNDNIIAVVGAGHETDIINLIKRYDKH